MLDKNVEIECRSFYWNNKFWMFGCNLSSSGEPEIENFRKHSNGKNLIINYGYMEIEEMNE